MKFKKVIGSLGKASFFALALSFLLGFNSLEGQAAGTDMESAELMTTENKYSGDLANGEADWYKLTTPDKNCCIKVTVTNTYDSDSYLYALNIKMLNEDGAYVTGCNSAGGSYDSYSCYGTCGAYSFYFMVDKKTDYYIVLKKDSNYYSTVISYANLKYEVLEDASNTFEDAEEIKYDTKYSGQIIPKEDVEWYKIPLKSLTSTYKFSVTSEATSNNNYEKGTIYYSLYRPDKSAIKENIYVGEGQTEDYSLICEKGEDFDYVYLKIVNAYPSLSLLPKYHFTVTSEPLDLAFVTWSSDTSKSYWYEKGVRQGTYSDANGVLGDGTIRGREIYDSETDGWYWLDACYNGAKAVDKEVWMPYIYQGESNWSEEEIVAQSAASGNMAAQVADAIRNGTGKWVRYDSEGKMYKGWYRVGLFSDLYPSQRGNTYYYDQMTGLMAKGYVEIDGKTYHFDEITGALIN